MTILQVQNTLRVHAAKQINLGRASIKLLAAKTGLDASTVSNFVRGKRGLSVAAMSRMLTALGFEADIYPLSRNG